MYRYNSIIVYVKSMKHKIGVKLMLFGYPCNRIKKILIFPPPLPPNIFLTLTGNNCFCHIFLSFPMFKCCDCRLSFLINRKSQPFVEDHTRNISYKIPFKYFYLRSVILDFHSVKNCKFC